MGVIDDKIKHAANLLYGKGDAIEAMKAVAHVGDYSVHSASQAGDMYSAIRKHFKKPSFECIFYDGENGVYHLLDFNPNGLSKKKLIRKIKNILQYQYHIDPCELYRFIESVYLIDSNMLIKVDEGENDG